MWDELSTTVEGLGHGMLRRYGYVWHNGSWMLSSNDSGAPKVYPAANFYAENHLHIGPIASVRLGRGLRQLPAISGYVGAITIVWSPGRAHRSIIEQVADSGVIDRLRLAQDFTDWTTLRIMQLLVGSENVVLAHKQDESVSGDSGRTLPEAVPGNILGV